uniref:DA-P36 family member n=1 Tax=Rhipicephalus appendiculatus TaxID=34631 RepID=A0A131YTI4_RHIAP
MKAGISVGFIYLLVLTQGVLALKPTMKTNVENVKRNEIRKVNLTNEVEKFFETFEGGNVNSWNMTGGKRPGHERIVTASVGQVHYNGDCYHSKRFDYKNCKETYVWLMLKSILTPFRLPISVTVLYKGEENKTLDFNLNNATSAQWNPDNAPYPINYTSVSVEQECNFSVPVTLNGYIAIHRRYQRGDNPYYDVIGIGKIAKPAIGLRSNGDVSKLFYNVSGTYRHDVICPPVTKSPKKGKNRRDASQKATKKKLPGS